MKYAFDRLVAPRVAAIARDGRVLVARDWRVLIARDGRVPITRDNRGVGAPRC